MHVSEKIQNEVNDQKYIIYYCKTDARFGKLRSPCEVELSLGEENLPLNLSVLILNSFPEKMSHVNNFVGSRIGTLADGIHRGRHCNPADELSVARSQLATGWRFFVLHLILIGQCGVSFKHENCIRYLV